MTVSSIVPVNTYTGNSSVKKFDFDFLIENENELIVEHISEDNVITRLTLGVDYSINEIGNQNGSYIIFPLETSSYNILKENEKINLMLTLAIMQESEFKNSSYFNLNILEWTFDYIIRILQILNRKVERSIKVNEGSDILPDELVKNLFNAEANAKISETNAKQSETNAKASETATAQLKNETNQIKQDAQNIADKALQDISTTKTSVIEEINTTKTAAIASVNSTKDVANASVNATKDQAVQEVQTEGSRQKAQMQDYVDLAKDWANKTDGTVDGTEYSAKYYAEKAKDHSAVTYTQLMASPGYARGEVSDDTEGYQNVLSYAHSTFDLSKFTVVGSPTITEDGIASGFSYNDSIRTLIQVNKISTNFFQINCGFTWNSSQGTLFSSAVRSNVEYGIALIINDQKLGFYVSSNGTSWDVINYETGSTALESGVPYIATIIFNGSQYICKLLNLNTNVETTEFIVESTSKVYAGNNYIYFGGRSYWNTLDGSIDLKSFAIWVDGVPVFNGNITGTDTINEIEIPYTLAKSGSKIVDVAYRDRVQDLYEQTGEAMYYTIDEQNQNFTLPMGEVYGMITQKANVELTNLTNGLANVICTTAPTKTSSASVQKPAVVIENYVNGTSWYRVWSDGWIEQGGQIGKVGTDQTVTVTLLQPFSTTNYFVSNTNLAGNVGSGSDPSCNSVGVRNTSGFQLMQDQTVGNGIIGCIWYACGY